MIQRIQTLYLLVSAILLSLLFFMPFVEITKEGVVYLFNFKGVFLEGAVIENGIAILALAFVVLVMHGIAILGYKKRMSQIRTIVFALILLFVLFGMLLFVPHYFYSDSQISYKISHVFPVIAILLDYLAIRSIRKDEALIRSIDRIR